MSPPWRFLIRMIVFLAAVAGVAVLLRDGLELAFSHNVGLNSMIGCVFAIGVVLNFRRVVMLSREIRWVEVYRSGMPLTTHSSPRLLAPLATMLGERRDRLNLTPLALRTLLDGLGAKLDESHEIARYFTGLMIFLGLLGTFWGLSQTVGSIGDVIRNLTMPGDDVQTAFAALKAGLDKPLAGMGTAFSTSLLGLSGSLVLGFLDLQAGQAQNAFYADLEDWLSAQTRLSSGAGAGEGGDQSVPSYVQALLEQTADSLEQLQRMMARGEESRISTNVSVRALTDRMGTLVDQMKTEQGLIIRLGEHQLEMKPLLARMAEQAGASAMDEASADHIRSIDQALSRLVEQNTGTHDELIREMRSEFRLLARTIAALAGEGSPAAGAPAPLVPGPRPGAPER